MHALQGRRRPVRRLLEGRRKILDSPVELGPENQALRSSMSQGLVCVLRRLLKPLQQPAARCPVVGVVGP